MKFFIISIILCTVDVCQCWSQDTLIIKDLTNEWFYYNAGDKNHQPLVELKEFKGNTLHFNIERSGSNSDYLQIISPEEITIFNRKLLIDVVTDTFMLPLSKLSESRDGRFPLTLYARNIDPEIIQAKVVRIANIEDSPLSSVAITYKRQRSAFSEFLTLSILVLAAIAAALYSYFPRVFSEYIKVSRAFSVRETEENLLKSRPLSPINLYFYAFLSLMSGLLIIGIYHMAKLQLPGFNRIYIYNLWFGLWIWLQVSTMVFLWFLGKLLLVYNVSNLFQLGNFSPNHFFNYLRILLIVVLLAASIFIFNFFVLSQIDPSWYHTFLIVLIMFFGLTVLMIFLKLMGASGLKNLHLFSYLCTTELVPYGILLSVVISQAN
ncbi:MAG: DUF4271 domain-containing protein [Bacteroidota bacterium]